MWDKDPSQVLYILGYLEGLTQTESDHELDTAHLDTAILEIVGHLEDNYSPGEEEQSFLNMQERRALDRMDVRDNALKERGEWTTCTRNQTHPCLLYTSPSPRDS